MTDHTPRSQAPVPLVETLRFQRDACERAGSALYARLLDGVIADVEQRGVCDSILRPHENDPFGSALPLRFLGAVHRLVLEGRAPELAAHFPTAGGAPHGDPVPALLETIDALRDEISARIDRGVQTNEVGRAAPLTAMFVEIARRTKLPLRVFEIGTSAGLNLRFDHFFYDTGQTSIGDPASPLRFTDVWEGARPDLGVALDVAERRGCDRNPIDPTTDDGRLTLLSFVWPDQLDRVEHLEAAIAIARQVPAAVDHADAGEWVEQRLAEPVADTATVVFHSIVLQYLPTETRHRVRDALRAAGERATPDASIHWARMEPAGDRADLRLTSWTGAPDDGDDEVLGECGYHGRPVWWR